VIGVPPVDVRVAPIDDLAIHPDFIWRVPYSTQMSICFGPKIGAQLTEWLPLTSVAALAVSLV
jgi:hypothetical protein